MSAENIKEAAKQYARDMTDDNRINTRWNPEVDSERSMYYNECDSDERLAAILSNETETPR